MNESALAARRASLRELRERLATATGAVVVGAGLVGVELAAELTHFFPRLGVTLVDGQRKVLPQLAETAREYAHQRLKAQGVRLVLGEPFSPESVEKDHEVLWCVGAKPRNEGLFAEAEVLTRRGLIRVNRRMQVLRRKTGSPGSESSGTAGPAPGDFERIGDGRIYAVGDAAEIVGLPTAQMIFHGEEMAAVAVAAIEAAEDVHSPLQVGKVSREAEAESLPMLCNCSLGPQDGMFSTQKELLATGTLAALQKQMIESTKLGALKGELLSSLVWMPVH